MKTLHIDLVCMKKKINPENEINGLDYMKKKINNLD
jgi:hypothetical protein